MHVTAAFEHLFVLAADEPAANDGHEHADANAAHGNAAHAGAEAEHGADEGGHDEGLMSMHMSLIVWTWVSFILLLVILGKFAWKPINGLLNKRAEGIEADINAARKIRDDAEQAKTDYYAQLNAAKDEIEQMRNDARAQAEVLKREIEDAAREEAKELKARATRDVELERSRVRAELRNQVVELALMAAERVIERSLTDDDHRRLATEVVSSLDRG